MHKQERAINWQIILNVTTSDNHEFFYFHFNLAKLRIKSFHRDDSIPLAQFRF